jgi:hypothetical protein
MATLKQQYLKVQHLTSEMSWVTYSSDKIQFYAWPREFTEDGVKATNFYTKEGGSKHWVYKGSKDFSWTEIARFPGLKLKLEKEFKSLILPFITVRTKGSLEVTNTDTKEKITCDFVGCKFIKTYANGREREVKHPNSFFKGYNGKLLWKMFPKENNSLLELVDLIFKHERNCRNFGTFLVRTLDKIHLESYISADAAFDYNAVFPYNYFDKPIREKLKETKIVFDTRICEFFGSDKDKARTVFDLIKDKPNFTAMVKVLSSQMQNFHNLVEHYRYDLKTLFAYCDVRNWSETVRDTPKRPDYGGYYNYKLLDYIADYARMSEMVLGQGNFEKYPENIRQAHNDVLPMFNERKQEFDEKSYEQRINLKLEFEDDDFKIVYPKKTDDIVAEGKALRHCVGGYVRNVIEGRTTILFLRKLNELHTPFVTLELRDGSIVQAKGRGNSAPPYDAKQFLKEYSKKKKLLFSQA